MITVPLIRDGSLVALGSARSSKDLYLQLYEGIRELILSGQIAPGEKLPSKKKLASHLGVSVKTVENAYFQLMLEGYIRSKEKVGYFAENIEGFYRGSVPARPQYVNRYRETAYRVDLSANKSPVDLFPLSVWNRLGREVMSESGSTILETVPFNGTPELRIAIAQHLQGFLGLSVSPDQIIVGSGTEYLYSRLITLMGPSAVVGMEDPSYAHIRKVLENMGVPVRPIPVDEDGMRVDLLRQSDCTIVNVSPMHSFPLGRVMPVQRRVDLLKWLNEPGTDRFIVEDDYNSEYLYQGSPVPTLTGLDVRDRVIYLNTFSRTMAPGIRVAYLVLPERLMERFLDTMSFYSCTVPRDTQLQLARFIAGGHLERNIHRIRQFNVEQRKMVIECIESSPLASRIEVQRSAAGTHFLLQLDTDVPDEEIAKVFEARSINASFASDYCSPAIRGNYEHLLILNYSRVDKAGLEMLLCELQKAM